MANQPGTDASANDAPATLAKFHLGLAAAGMSCAMVFVDTHQHSIGCIAGLSDLMGFISSLQRVAREMARRQALLDEDGEQAAFDAISGAINERVDATQNPDRRRLDARTRQVLQPPWRVGRVADDERPRRFAGRPRDGALIGRSRRRR